MAVREFTDERGRRWRAWDVRPESIHPATRAEDYLVDCYITGWIVFETVEGDEKRRLCPWPMRWASEPDERLREFLHLAQAITRRKLGMERETIANLPSYEVEPGGTDGDADITDLHVVRSFRYPGGRVWTVGVVLYPEIGGVPVLRFSSGSRYFDLTPWPRDWMDRPDDGLVALLRHAAPRPYAAIGRDVPRRRWNDPPAPAA